MVSSLASLHPEVGRSPEKPVMVKLLVKGWWAVVKLEVGCRNTKLAVCMLDGVGVIVTLMVLGGVPGRDWSPGTMTQGVIL